MTTVNQRNAHVVKLYADGYTLQEVGNVVGLTRERVRQICEGLKAPARNGRAAKRLARHKKLHAVPKVTTQTVSLKELLHDLKKRVEHAGSFHAFARQHGYTAAAWNNILQRGTTPTDEVLRVLGYRAEPPRFRRI